MSSEGERLGQYVFDRRTFLDLTQLEVWQAGGPSNTTLSGIEKGELETLTRATARKLDKGLQWEPGGARAVWRGEEPKPLIEGVKPQRSARLRRAIEALDMDEATRAKVLAVIEDEDREVS